MASLVSYHIHDGSSMILNLNVSKKDQNDVYSDSSLKLHDLLLLHWETFISGNLKLPWHPTLAVVERPVDRPSKSRRRNVTTAIGSLATEMEQLKKSLKTVETYGFFIYCTECMCNDIWIEMVDLTGL